MSIIIIVWDVNSLMVICIAPIKVRRHVAFDSLCRYPLNGYSDLGLHDNKNIIKLKFYVGTYSSILVPISQYEVLWCFILVFIFLLHGCAHVLLTYYVVPLATVIQPTTYLSIWVPSKYVPTYLCNIMPTALLPAKTLIHSE